MLNAFEVRDLLKENMLDELDADEIEYLIDLVEKDINEDLDASS